MTNDQTKTWIIENYHNTSDRQAKKTLKMGGPKYARLVKELIDAGEIKPKQQYRNKLQMTDKQVMDLFENRAGTIPELAKSLGISKTSLECRVHYIRQKSKPEPVAFELGDVCVHPLVTKRWDLESLRL